jgi:hypothetical protein
MVAGFIALLNVAVTTAPWQTPVAPPNGTTETTVGGVREGGGPLLLESGSLHPAIPTAKRNAGIQILAVFNLRISFSSSLVTRRSTPLAEAERTKTQNLAG